MSISQIRFSSASTLINRKATRLSAMAMLVLGAMAATGAVTAGTSSEANARYQAERAECLTGQASQDRATCLREAGAALQESRVGHLNGAQDAYHQNALIRCNALPTEDRDACQRRIEGAGTTSGSVREGGLVRELVVPDNK